MELRRLDLEQVRGLYAPCLERDFPADERMPWKWMEGLIQRGRQESAGFYQGEALVAYALFVTEGEGSPAALLNYFAVEPGCRGQGVGSQCLGLLREALRGRDTALLFEVEAPESAHNWEELETRRRRIAFYERSGARLSGVDSWLFGVDYHIMRLPPAGEEAPPPDPERVAASLERLYRGIIPARLEGGAGFETVCRVWVRDEGGERARFSRELGRALTFLFRERKKFMGEALGEYDFSGAMYMILLHVARHPGASQDSIAHHMYLDKCSVARRTKKLEELGCLYRETDRSDRRQNQLYLTEKGQSLAPVIRACLTQWGESATARLTQKEKDTLLGLLTKMTGQDTR